MSQSGYHSSNIKRKKLFKVNPTTPQPTATTTPSASPSRDTPIPRTGRRDDDVESATIVESGRGFVDEVMITYFEQIICSKLFNLPIISDFNAFRRKKSSAGGNPIK